MQNGGEIMNIYGFNAKTIDGEEKSLREYENKVLLIVNTASKCGFTPQFKGLQELYNKYGNQNFEILGFPCDQFMHQEPGTNEEIKNFCEINFGVSFPLFEKIEVNGDEAHPIYKYLRKEQSGLLTDAIKWNFTKFLINSKGEVVKRYAPSAEPKELEKEIEELISQIS